jgi:hypothetical protein
MIRHAVTNGLIEVQIKEVDGHLLRRYEPAFDTSTLSGDVDSDLATIRRRFGVFLRAQGGVKTGTPTTDPFDQSGILLRAIRGKKETAADKGSDTVVEIADRRPETGRTARPDRRAYGVSLIGRLALPPKVTDVAGCLLLAHAVVDNRVRLQTLRQVLSQPTPIIAIYVLAGGFEKVMVRLLKAGVIIREPMAGAAGEYVFDRSPFDFEEKEATRRFVHFLGEGYHHSSESNVRMRIGQAIDAGHPIVAIAEKIDKIPDYLTIGADLSIYSSGMSWTILLDLLQATCEATDVEVLDAYTRASFDPSLLTLNDLSLSIRPGRSLSDIFNVMTVLTERTAATEETKDAAKNKKERVSTEAKARPAEPLASTTERRNNRDNRAGPTGEVIMPEDIPRYRRDCLRASSLSSILSAMARRRTGASISRATSNFTARASLNGRT